MFNFFNKKKNTILQLDKVLASDISAKQLKKLYIDKRRPLIIKGGANSWPLIKKWNKEYISENMGGYVCKIINDSRPAYAKEQTTLKIYFNKFPGYSTLTLDVYDDTSPPLFMKDIKMPNIYFSKKDISRFFFYHSVKDAGTLPHIHGDAFNILQQGEKHWVFYDASKMENEKGYHALQKSNRKYNIGSHAKQWFAKELKKLPSQVDEVFECIQEAGDIIFIPAGYSHAVLNKSEVMGIVFETKQK
ncbi:MAG: cupin-like domain-containing protein [Flavobacteriaceae bacterium]|nr:cupin-like domain-containing protein [Flavobacteriaceae bacterium]